MNVPPLNNTGGKSGLSDKPRFAMMRGFLLGIAILQVGSSANPFKIVS
jgi:hypothetical protein